MGADQAQAGETDPAEVRVSTIELFFDLVFVFAITQLTSLLAGEPTMLGLGRVVLIFGNLWWIYGGDAWLTNAVPPRQLVLRLLLLVGMGGFLVVALAIPTAFDGGVDRATWLALYGFGSAFLPILSGTIVFAAGVKNAAVQYGEPLTASAASWPSLPGSAT